ncbi:amidase [bacterium]|nr:amidase [bacterium]MBP9810829.1 amidase [bacterium]
MSYNGIIANLDIAEIREEAQAGSGAAASGAAQPLAGLRFAVKDLFAIAGRTTGFGNPDWLNTHQPESVHAEVVSQLLKAQAKLIAVTCTDEMAFSLDGINIHYGTPLNSQLPDCIPGGSSSGSASTVAAGLVDFALGTDTAGSIRVPASYCGIWGLRPTYGAISSIGVLPLGPSFDTVGILAPSRLILDKVASALLNKEGTEATRNANKQIKQLLICDDLLAQLEPNLAPDIVTAIAKASASFATVKHIKISDTLELNSLVSVFNAIRAYEAWQCHGQWLGSTSPNMAPAIKERFFNCKDATEDEATKARSEQQKLRQKLAKLLADDSALCFPTTITLPPPKLASAAVLQQNRMANMPLSAMASLSGFPQISIPISLGNHQPIVKTGLSLLANSGMDLAIINAAAAFQ